MKRSYKSEFSNLRQKAEELLITKISKSDSPLSETDTLKLIHELEVHQIELELQNKELNLARSAALLTAEKFTELYDFSPTSYFSLSKEGRIVELNLGAAKMLGKARSVLIDNVFGFFVSSDTKQRFSLFLKQVFTSNAKETCEVTLLTSDGTQMVVLLIGIPTENGKQCLLSVVDITERSRLDSILKTRNSILELSYHCSLDELLQKTLDEVEILSKSKISFFHFVEEDQVTLSLQTWSTNTLQKMCSADGKGQHYPIDQAGVWVDCIAARAPVIHNDYLSLPHRKGLPAGHAPVIRELVVPILRNEKIVAILGVGNKESDYDQTDVQSITEIADILWDIVVLKKGDEKIKESQLLLKSSIESPKDIIIFSFDKQYRYLYFNEYHHDIMFKEYGKDVSVGMSVLEYMTADNDRLRAKINFDRALKGECHITVEEYGEINRYYFETRYNPIINDKNEIIGATVFSTDVTYRIRVKEALTESEMRYRDLFDKANEGLILLTMDGKMAEVNRSFAEMHGYTVDEIKNMDIRALDVLNERTFEDRADIMRRINAGEVVRFEAGHYHKDRHIIILSNTVSLINIGGQKFYMAFHQDITDHKLAEESIRSWNNRFKKLSENAPGLIYQFTRRPDGTYYVPIASEGIRNIFGCSPEDVIDDFTPIGSVIYPEDSARVISDIEYSADHLSYFTCEFRVQIPGKEIQWIYSKSTPEKLPDGSITWYGFNTDITERKQTEKKLKENSALLLAQLNSTIDGVLVIDSNNKRLLLNKRFIEMVNPPRDITDSDEDTLLLQYVVSLTKYPEKFLEKVTYLNNHPDEISSDEIEFKSGMILDRYSAPVLDKDGKNYGRIWIFRDITNRKRDENELIALTNSLEERIVERTRQLATANNELTFHLSELEQFSYISNHDLQEPLRTLTQFTQLLNEKYAGKLDEEGTKCIEFISKSAIRMSALVKDLLEYSLLGKESLKTIVDCNKIVNEVLGDLDDSIKESTTKLTVQVLPTLNGYETELRLLSQNLIGNAVKYQKPDMVPEVNISAESREKDWLFSIKDNGIGIDQKHHEKIFIIFQRLHNRNEFEGTGIGLAHCKKIVEMHGGKIWVESTPGAGSTFLFTIPK
jgi:PAS domain S-box-containing protein